MLLYDPAPMEMIVTPKRIIQNFEWTWDHREIWLDGRPLPKVEEYLPRWDGYSVGTWEGDTWDNQLRKIVQTPKLLVLLVEYNSMYRQIFLDGRPLPVDPNPAWSGYSTGHWDGDTLVVQSAGFKDGQWLDTAADPLTDAAKVTERFRRPDFGHLQIDVTIDDHKVYSKPWSVRVNQVYAADTDLLEFICLENEKDIKHMAAGAEKSRGVSK